MKKIFYTLVFVLTLSGVALAEQYVTKPTISGHPEYGFTTKGPNGSTSTTKDAIFGHPEYGQQTSGPNGQRCVTKSKIFGKPEYGVETTCQ